MKILTDISEPRVCRFWSEKTETYKDIVGGKGLISDTIAALIMIMRSFNYDSVILNTSRKGSIYVIIRSLLPFKSPKIVIGDCLWYLPGNPLKLLLKKILFRIQRHCIAKYIVWSSHEVDDYSRAFGIPKEKFIYIPHHHTLEGYEFEVSNGEYIFSGGDGDRDYETLLRAVEGLGVRLVIATRLNNWNGDVTIPEEVKAFPTSHVDFRKWMAGSKLVVVPMKKGLLHSGGQQTYLSAMAMGKPVIVADDCGVKDYIENRVNGLIVPAGDADALRIAIKSILDNSEFGANLAGEARKVYDIYSTPKCMERILQAAEKIALRNSKKPNSRVRKY